jgi:hypothetical protein
MVGDQVDVAGLSTVVIEITEQACGFAHGSVARPTASEQFLDATVEMKAKLFVYFLRELPVRQWNPEDTSHAGPSEAAPHRLGSGASTCDTARV